MNDNEKNNNLTDNEDITEDNIEKTSLPERDEDTEYMMQVLAERKRGRNSNQTQTHTQTQTQTIDRPAATEPKHEVSSELKLESKPEQAKTKPRRFYNQDENNGKHHTVVDKIIKLPIVPIILGIVVVAVTAALIVILTDRISVSDTSEGSDREADISQTDNASYDVPDWITVNLLPKNDQSRPGTELDAVNGAVVHYVGNPGTSAEQNRNYFAGLAKVKDVYASSNFIIGLDGEILMVVPPDEVAYCSNSRNYDTLSIECCHPDDTGEFTEETYQSLIKLLAWMCEEFDFAPSDIIRHYDITGKECPKDYVVNPEKWDQMLSDVGAQLRLELN